MTNEVRPLPRLPNEDRPRRFSWKGFALAAVALLAFAIPILFIILN